MIFYPFPPSTDSMFSRHAKRFGSTPRYMVPDDEILPQDMYQETSLHIYDGGVVAPEGGELGHQHCMGATRWQKYLNYMLIDKYTRQYQSDGFYLDGIGLVSFDCANLNHGHTVYGEWHRGLHQWVGNLVSATRKIRPGAVFVGDGMCDADHRFLDAGLFCLENALEVSRYTSPRNVGILLGWPPTDYRDDPMGPRCVFAQSCSGFSAARCGGFQV